MLSKKKCPMCGAKNPRKRMTCIECGALLTFEAVDQRPSKVPQESAPNLSSTMKQTTTRRKGVWFWLGVILLSVSALFWLILISIMIDNGEDIGLYILTGVLLTVVPIGIGIYGVRRGRKTRTIDMKMNPETNAPKLIVNPNCAGVLSEFGVVPSPLDGQTRAYRWKMDRDGNIVGESPEDKNNHGVKAVIYGLVDKFGYGHVGNRSFISVKRWA